MICLRRSGRRASRSRLLLYYPRTAADKQTVRWRDQRGEAWRPGSSTSPACAQQRHHRLSTAKSATGFSCPDLGLHYTISHTVCSLGTKFGQFERWLNAPGNGWNALSRAHTHWIRLATDSLDLSNYCPSDLILKRIYLRRTATAHSFTVGRPRTTPFAARAELLVIVSVLSCCSACPNQHVNESACSELKFRDKLS